MFNANEMKKVALEKQAERYEVEEAIIVSSILQASDNGSTAITVAGELSNYLTKKLRDNDYVVNVNNSSYQKEPTTTTISWGD